MGSEQLKCLQGTRQKQCIKMLLSLEQLGLTRGFSVIDFLSTAGCYPFFRMVLLETSARLGRPWILSQSVAGDYPIYAVFTFLLSCHSAVRVSNTY